ncbi:MAG: TldD/PmbA family protein [bacterium]|nr:TldD/PmbA family protein [bacterium]
MSTIINTIEKDFKDIIPASGYCSLRFVRRQSEEVCVRQDVLQPLETLDDTGIMITVINEGGMGYAGTCDLTKPGLTKALEEAQHWAKFSAGKSVVDYTKLDPKSPNGEYATPVKKPWETVPLKEKIDILKQQCARLNTDDRIVDWMVYLVNRKYETCFITGDGGKVYQAYNLLIPFMQAVANEGSETQIRSTGSRGGKQGGLEILDDIGFYNAAPVLAEEALQLLSAPNCPEGTMDLVLDPDQMILQVHESIGHPLEIDRILGDERNYAGTSFVSPDMFGSYRYGSDLLNITFDPTVTDQFASYAFDDDGEAASKEYIIEKGILKRGLGSISSQARSGLMGVANSRATGWNRPPIDRMANLNLEPGSSSFDEIISSVEKGVYMKTNSSWSIDDSRNKFQFGCEWGQLIEKGKLTTVVKKPNYRGISANFWRNLAKTGSRETFEVMGTPNCGKGEPNQVIWVGHASPVCLFSDVAVFGGE